MATTINFSSGLKSIPAELYLPPGGVGKGAIVIAYKSDGLIDDQNGPWETMIRGYGEELARAGFVALISN